MTTRTPLSLSLFLSRDTDTGIHLNTSVYPLSFSPAFLSQKPLQPPLCSFFGSAYLDLLANFLPYSICAIVFFPLLVGNNYWDYKKVRVRMNLKNDDGNFVNTNHRASHKRLLAILKWDYLRDQLMHRFSSVRNSLVRSATGIVHQFGINNLSIIDKRTRVLSLYKAVSLPILLVLHNLINFVSHKTRRRLAIYIYVCHIHAHNIYSDMRDCPLSFILSRLN